MWIHTPTPPYAHKAQCLINHAQGQQNIIIDLLGYKPNHQGKMPLWALLRSPSHTGPNSETVVNIPTSEVTLPEVLRGTAHCHYEKSIDLVFMYRRIHCLKVSIKYPKAECLVDWGTDAVMDMRLRHSVL
jgi:hypothetical protein